MPARFGLEMGSLVETVCVEGKKKDSGEEIEFSGVTLASSRAAAATERRTIEKKPW